MSTAWLAAAGRDGSRSHRDLQTSDPRRGATVTATALRWGFTNMSRFAHDYRASYGRPPSHTLRADAP